MYSAFNNKYTYTLQLKVIKLSLESLCLMIEHVLSIYKAQQHIHLHTQIENQVIMVKLMQV